MLSKYNKSIIKKIRTRFNTEEDIKYNSIYLIIILLLIFLVSGLFNLQIVKGRQNLLASTRTSQSISLVLPPRGLIYDKNGELLAYNTPSYSLYIDKDKVPVDRERELIDKIAKILGRDTEELLDTYRKEAYQTTNERTTGLVTGINSDKYFKLVEQISDMEGVHIESESQRMYKDAQYFSHLVGYIGRPTEGELGEGVYTISQVGKTGVEKVYDNYLRGKAGKEVVQRQYLEDLETTFQQEQVEDGGNIYLTIDSKWQKKLFDIMQASLEETEAFASAGVVMNSDTGEVKALVSLPSYDNNLFINTIGSDQYNKLIKDDKTPLLNRPIALQLPSGSVFKVVTATAALETNVVNKDTVINSEGCMQLSAGIEFCEADRKVLGNLTIKSALSKSSNLFFCRVAMRFNSDADGIRSVLAYADQYGLGKKTGIDLVGEQMGTLPSPELKKRLLGENWYVGDDCNSVIGQGLLTVTPIQMVVTASTINNGGKVLKPHVLGKIEDQNRNILKEVNTEVVRELDISKTNLDIIKEGMRMATKEGGSGSQLSNLPGNIIIKTGSADASEIISGKRYTGAHSWVIGCFEDKGENYCFTVMQQWGGRGYRTVPIIKKFINCVQKDFAPQCQDIL